MLSILLGLTEGVGTLFKGKGVILLVVIGLLGATVVVQHKLYQSKSEAFELIKKSNDALNTQNKDLAQRLESERALTAKLSQYDSNFRQHVEELNKQLEDKIDEKTGDISVDDANNFLCANGLGTKALCESSTDKPSATQ